MQTQRAIRRKSLDNKRAYADHHGYELIVHEPAATLPAPWSKIDALLLHLHRFDWLLYLDGDALAANPAICLESFLDDAFDVVMAEDWGGYNTGAFFVRNSSFSRRSSCCGRWPPPRPPESWTWRGASPGTPRRYPSSSNNGRCII